jgi:hypothetical protein
MEEEMGDGSDEEEGSEEESQDDGEEVSSDDHEDHEVEDVQEEEEEEEAEEEQEEEVEEEEEEEDIHGRASDAWRKGSDAETIFRSEGPDSPREVERRSSMALDLRLPRDMFRDGPWKTPEMHTAFGDLSKVAPRCIDLIPHNVLIKWF